MTWLIILSLIVINALYVAAEFAAVSVRRSSLQQLAEEGNNLAKRLLPSLKDASKLDHYIAACQIGITLSSLVLGAYGQATLARDLAPLFINLGGLQEAAAQSISAAFVLILLTILQVIFGELVPKSLALQYSTQAALSTFIPMKFSLGIFSWFIAVLNGSGIAIMKLLRVPYGGHRHIHSPEEIELLIAESRDGGLLEEDEHQRLKGALHLASMTAGELMVPRRFMHAVDADAPLDEILRLVCEGPYSHVPVYRGNRDRIEGVVHARDMMLQYLDKGDQALLSAVIHPAVYVPAEVTADGLLRLFREEKSHQAIVIDEYGGVHGLVTLEDLLAKLFGHMGDELKPPQPGPERLADGRVRMPGLFSLSEMEAWAGIQWHGEAATLGGHVIETLGHIPAEGEKVTIGGVLVEVERMESHAVASLLITPVSACHEEVKP